MSDLRAVGGIKKKQKKTGGATGTFEFHKSKGQHILKNPLVVQVSLGAHGREQREMPGHFPAYRSPSATVAAHLNLLFVTGDRG